MTLHEDYKREQMKNWKFRFWYYLLAPQYWITKAIIKLKIRLRRK